MSNFCKIELLKVYFLIHHQPKILKQHICESFYRYIVHVCSFFIVLELFLDHLCHQSLHVSYNEGRLSCPKGVDMILQVLLYSLAS